MTRRVTEREMDRAESRRDALEAIAYRLSEILDDIDLTEDLRDYEATLQDMYEVARQERAAAQEIIDAYNDYATEDLSLEYIHSI